MKLTDTALKILKNRYFLSEYDDAESLFAGVADKVCGGDNVEFRDECLDSMCKLEFLPNTPTLINARRDGGQLSACFVLPTEDSTDSIFETLKRAALIFKSGGGVGYSFTNLRPRGSVVAGSFGVSSGPVSFMRVFDAATGEMRQGGTRKGANMGVLRIDHPDIEEFVTCKNEEGVLSNFNISVAITDDFMKCLVEKKPFYLRWSNGKIRIKKEVNPQYLWDLIVAGAWKNGEPGILFIDEINEKNLLKDIETIEATNPCQMRNATVLTPEGISTIGEIKVGSVIWSSDGWVNVTKKRFSGIKKVYNYNTSTGVFTGTKNHRIVENGKKVQAQNAGGIDKLRGSYRKRYLYEHINPRDVMDGIVLAGGYVHKTGLYGYKRVVLIVGEKDQDYFSSEVEHLILHEYSNFHTFVVQTTVTPEELPRTYYRRMPDRFKYSDGNTVCGVLRGLYSSNGYVIENGNRVGMSVSSSGMARDVQLLLSSLGIASYLIINEEVDVKHYNGVYASKRSYIVNIVTDRKRFRTLIGFLQKDKIKALNKICALPVSTKEKICCDITSVEYVKRDKVYNIKVDGESHTYWSGGVSIGNCSEEPLPPYGACVLGSINLGKFVEDGKTDYIRLEKTIRMGVRFLDNVVSVNTYPLQELEDESLKTRRIGLGIMGLADLLIKKDLVYGSPKCIEYLHKLMSFFSDTAHRVSEDLGVERGVPPVLSEVGINRRNGTVTTIAPTGSLSLIAGCSGGCEPIFAKEYKKRCIDTSVNVKSSTISEGSAFITAMDVPPEDHVRVLSVLQRYIDAGISKTINAPNSITEDEISKLFMLCYSTKCKSISFYRNGSRALQALTDVKSVKDGKTDKVDKRPKCVMGYTQRVKTGRGKLYVTVNNNMDGKPFEVFLRIGKSGMEDLAYSEAMGRLISLALRSGISPKVVIKNLAGISGESSSWVDGRMIKSVPDAVSYVLSQICGDEESRKKELTKSLLCPDCSHDLVVGEGCVTCPECGWSRCS